MKKRFFNKLSFLLFSALMSVTFSACFGSLGESAAYKSIEGYSDVKNAKKLYTELDSGHFYMQDNASGSVTMEFIFKYRADGKLTYFYMGSDGDEVYYEFHNGSELDHKKKGNSKWQFEAQGGENYFVYDRKNRHPYTEEGVISMNAYAVTESKLEETENGKKITFYYDAEKLKESLSMLGELKSFESTIWIDGGGYCYRLDQKGVFDNEGVEEISDYSMFIDEMNEIEEVKRPEGL